MHANVSAWIYNNENANNRKKYTFFANLKSGLILPHPNTVFIKHKKCV